jgi:hypothetical protein
MDIKLTLALIKKSRLSPDALVMLQLLYYKKFDDIAEIFGKTNSIKLRNRLIVTTDFILSHHTEKFTDTILSNKAIEKLFEIRSDVINFWEFYNCYPVKVGSRVLRAAGPTTQIALKHEKKYLARVKTTAQHQVAIAAINAFVAKQKSSGKLEFLPNMETVMNNSSWEQWEVFIQENGKEEEEWNSTTI